MSSPSTRRTPCPRCSEPVPADYKFCPACAYRLRSNAESPRDPLAPRERWLAVSAAVLLGLLLAGVVALGFLLFSKPEVVPDGAAEGPLTVRRDLLRLFVNVPPGDALYEWDPTLPETEKARPVYVPYYSALLKYEVTRGMYAEFLTDTRDDPEGIWPLLRKRWETDNLYVDRWWTRFTEHLSEIGIKGRDRPAGLSAPLPEAYGNLLAVPPSWVTMGLYEDFTWAVPEGTENLPVTEVSWFDAVAFANWVNRVLDLEEDKKVRLPREAEWLLAANGGKPEFHYPWGNEVLRFGCNNLTWWRGEDGAQLLRVDFPYPEAARNGRSRDGLWAMSGNAREWAHPHSMETAEDGQPIVENGHFLVKLASGEETDLFTTAPTLGGSYLEGIHDCTVDRPSVRYKEKVGRWPEVGFRLWMHGNPYAR